MALNRALSTRKPNSRAALGVGEAIEEGDGGGGGSGSVVVATPREGGGGGKCYRPLYTFQKL